jgi:hypothetical protein
MDAKERAEYFGAWDDSNFLAHSIRRMELELIRKEQLPYHILTVVALQDDSAKILFSKAYCLIFLPSKSEDRDERSIRLSLGHELGHLVLKFNELKNSTTLDNKKLSDEEELFAWKFAYHLIDMKSEQHANDIERQRYIYKKSVLKNTVSDMVKVKNPGVHRKIREYLGL